MLLETEKVDDSDFDFIESKSTKPKNMRIRSWQNLLESVAYCDEEKPKAVEIIRTTKVALSTSRVGYDTPRDALNIVKESKDVTDHERTPIEQSFYESFLLQRESDVNNLYNSNVCDNHIHKKTMRHLSIQRTYKLGVMNRDIKAISQRGEQLKQRLCKSSQDIRRSDRASSSMTTQSLVSRGDKSRLVRTPSPSSRHAYTADPSCLYGNCSEVDVHDEKSYYQMKRGKAKVSLPSPPGVTGVIEGGNVTRSLLRRRQSEPVVLPNYWSADSHGKRPGLQNNNNVQVRLFLSEKDKGDTCKEQAMDLQAKRLSQTETNISKGINEISRETNERVRTSGPQTLGVPARNISLSCENLGFLPLLTQTNNTSKVVPAINKKRAPLPDSSYLGFGKEPVKSKSLTSLPIS